MIAGGALLVMGFVLLVVGGVALFVSKRTGEVHSLWFGKHPENIARVERAYLYAGIASLATGVFIVMLGTGSMMVEAMAARR